MFQYETYKKCGADNSGNTVTDDTNADKAHMVQLEKLSDVQVLQIHSVAQ